MRAIGHLAPAHRDRADEGYSLEKERELIRNVAIQRGFELGTVFEGGRQTRSQALAAVESSRADVLIVPRVNSICSTRTELANVLHRSWREQWTLLVMDVGIDTTTPIGRAQAERVHAGSQGLNLLNLPPPELRLRVTGEEDADQFAFSGWVHVETYKRLLGEHGYALEGFQNILDFGGGPGRIVRHLEMRTGAAIALCDIDAPAVTWVAQNLPDVDARLTGELPPLPFEPRSFDLILCFSVFTHLDEGHQDAWLAELARVSKPSGLVMATVHGDCSWRHHVQWSQNRKLAKRLARRGFLYRHDDGWGDFYPDFYHTAFHQAFYIRRHWSRWFDVLDIVPGEHAGAHDFVVLRRPSVLDQPQRRTFGATGANVIEMLNTFGGRRGRSEHA